MVLDFNGGIASSILAPDLTTSTEYVPGTANEYISSSSNTPNTNSFGAVPTDWLTSVLGLSVEWGFGRTTAPLAICTTLNWYSDRGPIHPVCGLPEMFLTSTMTGMGPSRWAAGHTAVRDITKPPTAGPEVLPYGAESGRNKYEPPTGWQSTSFGEYLPRLAARCSPAPVSLCRRRFRDLAYTRVHSMPAFL